MKTNLITALKLIIADRLVTVLLIAFIVACAAYCVSVAVSLHVSDLQIAVHYTAFGGTNFYREKWYYLLSFIGLGIVLAIAHSAIAIKLYAQERRQITLLFIGLSYLLLFITWVLTYSVLRIAAF